MHQQRREVSFKVGRLTVVTKGFVVVRLLVGRVLCRRWSDIWVEGSHTVLG